MPASAGTVGRALVPSTRQSYRLHLATYQQYINVIRLLHVEKGYDNPLQSCYVISLLQGVRREHAAPPVQKLSITPKILLSIYRVLDFQNQ